MKFLADENFDNRIVRGLLLRRPNLDIVRVQDLEITGADDPTVLAWAAHAGRILLTHDESSFAGFLGRTLLSSSRRGPRLRPQTRGCCPETSPCVPPASTDQTRAGSARATSGGGSSACWR